MRLHEYQQALAAIGYGKRVHSALYVYWGERADLGHDLNALLEQIQSGYGISTEYNVLKFRLQELKISFLAYPEFVQNPHPALTRALTIDLVTGRARTTEYVGNPNPPILHRKEEFLHPSDNKRERFAALTRAEEIAGLYEFPGTIGFKLNWERLLTEKGLQIRDGNLCRSAELENGSGCPRSITVDRHKTALVRYDLSRPTKTLIEHGMLKTGSTFFDYGCGLGADIQGLRALGYEADGWDPTHRPDSPKRSADVVNLGYVLNVIEDPAERLESLCDAFRLTNRLLVVSALMNYRSENNVATQFRDGLLTSRNTFQKYFEQQELHQYIEDALDLSAVPVSLGTFYVFRNPQDHQDFLAARTKRLIDWSEISRRLGLGTPPVRTGRTRVRIDQYEQHREVLDAFYSTMLDLGRLPEAGEFTRESDLRGSFGSPKKAQQLFIARFGSEQIEAARVVRCNDLLVYLAMSNLKKPVLFSHLSPKLRADIKAFFGDYKTALAKGKDLLYAAGDPDEIELACESLYLGVQDEQALYIHRQLLDSLPPVLRVYVGCASMRYGDVEQADIIKLHKRSGKVTFLVYEDFEDAAFPQLTQRIKVDLRSFFVNVFDYSDQIDPQLLYFKHRYVSPDHPKVEEMRNVGSKLLKLGINPNDRPGPTKREFSELIAREGLNWNLNKKRRREQTALPNQEL